MTADGYTGEWILQVKDLTGPEDARQTWDLLHEAIDELNAKLGGRVTFSFDESRWEGGSF